MEFFPSRRARDLFSLWAVSPDLPKSQKIPILKGFPRNLVGVKDVNFEIMMKTFSAKAETIQQDWYVVDGTNAVLGRLATTLAHHLRGKHKAEFTPHVDTGDFIVVVNADKIRVTGNKAEDKKYFRHSGYPGGISETTFGKMQDKFPGRALEIAVKGMLPKGPLGYAMLKKLKIYPGESHPHSAQQPKPLAV